MEHNASMPRTRLQAKKEKEEEEMMQAARTLMELSQAPPVFRKRSLTIYPGPTERAMKIAETSKPGETILLNFYIDQQKYATVIYLENQDGKIVRKRIEGPFQDFTMQWTYSVTDFPFYQS